MDWLGEKVDRSESGRLGIKITRVTTGKLQPRGGDGVPNRQSLTRVVSQHMPYHVQASVLWGPVRL